jgi:hypothetical protein
MRCAWLLAERERLEFRKRFCDTRNLHREVDVIPEKQRFLHSERSVKAFLADPK